jgi:hypothetical protein
MTCFQYNKFFIKAGALSDNNDYQAPKPITLCGNWQKLLTQLERELLKYNMAMTLPHDPEFDEIR